MCLPGQQAGPGGATAPAEPIPPGAAAGPWPGALPGPGAAAPSTAAGAVAVAHAALAALAAADPTALTVAEQADVLRALERAESVHAAARAKILQAFHAGDGCRDDGHGSAKTWLAWQTRVTKCAAGGAMGWMRRLAAHPAVAGAMAAGGLSCSWARRVCGWSDLLPEAARPGADQILVAAAAGGADLDGLAQLAEEIRRRTAAPDADGGGRVRGPVPAAGCDVRGGREAGR
jgi:hypothetical protein